MSTPQSRDFLLSHKFNVSLFVDLAAISRLAQKRETGVMNEMSLLLHVLSVTRELDIEQRFKLIKNIEFLFLNSPAIKLNIIVLPSAV